MAPSVIIRVLCGAFLNNSNCNMHRAVIKGMDIVSPFGCGIKAANSAAMTSTKSKNENLRNMRIKRR
jgi:hypothetical protein